MFDNLDTATREKIIAHIEAALAYDADIRRRKVLVKADTGRPSIHPICLMCDVAIRAGTNPVNGMHPRCARVAADPREALSMPMNGMAARCLLDKLYASRRRGDESLDRKAARELAHKELLAAFELGEREREAKSKARSA